MTDYFFDSVLASKLVKYFYDVAYTNQKAPAQATKLLVKVLH
jgi:hypothetical protein